MDERYCKGYNVPEKAIRQIQFGRLKGFSDINPQWKISTMTEIYGMCGIGWKYEIVEEKEMPIPQCGGVIALFMKVAVYIKDGENWSAPIFGMGGDSIVKIEKGKPYFNDEAYKMCLTDALGNALKNIGIGGGVYERQNSTKYNMPTQNAPRQNVPQSAPRQNVQQNVQRQNAPQSLRERFVSVVNGFNVPINEFAYFVSGGKARNASALSNEMIESVVNNPQNALEYYRQMKSALMNKTGKTA